MPFQKWKENEKEAECFQHLIRKGIASSSSAKLHVYDIIDFVNDNPILLKYRQQNVDRLKQILPKNNMINFYYNEVQIS